MKIGFIGLGHLGKEIAKRLISQGVDLVVYNRTKEKAKELGVEIADSPADLINKVDAVFIIVFDSEASKKVIFGEKGLIKGEIKNKTIIDMTTNHYKYVENTYKELKNIFLSHIVQTK
ncbi:NAD(P)-binding domain-containing protein, partial [Sulfurihydrogenibium azorense]|uniref:NAD(P)-binding domain-containing protein n=1 Tax=Sulfurihydrogenibium azorense TaxID=309806 RepID=UPI00391B7F15